MATKRKQPKKAKPAPKKKAKPAPKKKAKPAPKKQAKLATKKKPAPKKKPAAKKPAPKKKAKPSPKLVRPAGGGRVVEILDDEQPIEALRRYLAKVAGRASVQEGQVALGSAQLM